MYNMMYIWFLDKPENLILKWQVFGKRGYKAGDTPDDKGLTTNVLINLSGYPQYYN